MNNLDGTPPAVRIRAAMYAAVSDNSNAPTSQRSATRCFSCRNSGSSNRSAQLRLTGEDQREQLFALRLDVG